MVYVMSLILIVLNAVWLALVFFGLPGNWLIVGVVIWLVVTAAAFCL